MSSSVVQGGERTARRGYWGDIVVSPFISMGSWCPNKEMLKTANGRNAKVSNSCSAAAIMYQLLLLLPTELPADSRVQYAVSHTPVTDRTALQRQH